LHDDFTDGGAILAVLRAPLDGPPVLALVQTHPELEPIRRRGPRQLQRERVDDDVAPLPLLRGCAHREGVIRLRERHAATRGDGVHEDLEIGRRTRRILDLEQEGPCDAGASAGARRLDPGPDERQAAVERDIEGLEATSGDRISCERRHSLALQQPGVGRRGRRRAARHERHNRNHL
jgi:hypothetical protein